MRVLICLLFVLSANSLLAQSDFLLIGRNLGTKTLPDSNIIRTFGFAQKLNENPGVPGPVLHVKEGDSVTIDFWNISQGAGHTIHLHGLDVDQQNDGVPHLSFTVEHMAHGYYRFKAPHPGTYLYHCHVLSSIHVQAGMYGMLVVHAKEDSLKTWTGGYSFHQEYAFLCSEIDTVWHQDSILNQGHGDSSHTALIPKFSPQFFMVNGHADPQSLYKDSMFFRSGEQILLRFANIGFYANRMAFPSSLNARIIASDGRPVPTALQSDSLWVFPGERYEVLVTASIETRDSIKISYHNLNTLKQKGSVYLPFHVQGFLNTRQPSLPQALAYPNPGNGHVKLKVLHPNGVHQIQVFDSKGQAVYPNLSLDEETIQIDLSQFSEGVYLIRYQDNEGSVLSIKYLKTDLR